MQLPPSPICCYFCFVLFCGAHVHTNVAVLILSVWPSPLFCLALCPNFCPLVSGCYYFYYFHYFHPSSPGALSGCLSVDVSLWLLSRSMSIAWLPAFGQLYDFCSHSRALLIFLCRDTELFFIIPLLLLLIVIQALISDTQ